MFKRKEPYTIAEIHQYVEDISVLQLQREDAIRHSEKEAEEANLAIETAQWYLNFMLESNRHAAEKKQKAKGK